MFGKKLDRTTGWQLAIVLVAVLATCSVATADTIVDQSNTPATPWWGSVIYNQPIGQSFTPTLNSIDWAEFQITGASGTFQLALHDGTYNGTLLASSNLLTFGGGLAHFDFSSSVGLTPGNLYWLMILEPSGGNAGVLGDDNHWGTYPNGSAVIGGSFSSDFWFREGVNQNPVPEPAAILLVFSGVPVLWRKLRRG